MLVCYFDMKQWNGCNLGIKIKESTYKIKVILIIALEYIEDNSLNFELLQKPIPLKLLIKKVNNYLI